MSKVIRCTRCNRRLRNGVGWNIVFASGVVTGFLCPGCQTPQENTEAEINEATLDYSKTWLDPFGRAHVPAKAV